ncbi:hypothetical protein QTP88_001183 [Uroleucon formosanum]
MQTLKVSLKGHSDTRWSSKSNAIKPLNTQIKEVYGVLQNMIANSLNADTTSSAQSLLKNINLTFLFYLDVWNQILGQVDRATKALQMKTLTLDKAASLIQALKNSLQEFRNTEFEENFTRTSTLVNTLGITNTSMRFKKRKDWNFDVFINQLNWRYEKLMEVADDFRFLSGASLYNMSTIELKKAAMDLAMKYEKDINCAEFIDEITDFQHVVKIFLTMPVTAATCERSFSKLKLIKNYLRSTMGQERLSNLSILSIENEVAGEINFEDVIDEFAAIKSRKVKL